VLAAARRAQRRAHAPYSGFRVGCAIEAADGEVFTGCNVENASYGLTICAERAAACAAVVAGQRQFRRVVVVTSATTPTPPCGACRQFLAEFGTRVRVESVSAGGRRAWSLARLLPYGFGREHL